MNRIVLFILISCRMMISKGMDQGKETLRKIFSNDNNHIEVVATKWGTLYSLTRNERENIDCFISHMPISNEQKIALNVLMYEFIGKPSVAPLIQAYDHIKYEFNNYLFERYCIRRARSFFETSEEHCQRIAGWLSEQGIESNSEKKHRIAVQNRGSYFLLTAEDISLYEHIAVTQIRKEAMQKNKIIACLAMQEDYCQDITDAGLSRAKLELCYNTIKN